MAVTGFQTAVTIGIGLVVGRILAHRLRLPAPLLLVAIGIGLGVRPGILRNEAAARGDTRRVPAAAAPLASGKPVRAGGAAQRPRDHSAGGNAGTRHRDGRRGRRSGHRAAARRRRRARREEALTAQRRHRRSRQRRLLPQIHPPLDGFWARRSSTPQSWNCCRAVVARPGCARPAGRNWPRSSSRAHRGWVSASSSKSLLLWTLRR